MKIDIVKPIPSKKPTLIEFFYFNSAGRILNPKPTPINEKSHIPIGFPITSLRIIPKHFICPKPLSQLLPTTMQVLAIADKTPGFE
jgi:hypothetical protein